ncbi:MAG: hypothetical protein IJ666_01425 [Ruminococcus sp.]|nr:hypothetical protein [Ruminococcus sp.]
MNLKIVFKKTENTLITEDKILSFSFRKEAYTPYTAFSAVYAASFDRPVEFSEVMFYINDILIHHGLVNSSEVKKDGRVYTGRISSRSFTSLLRQNQMEPGIYTQKSLNWLVDSFREIPYITHEDNSQESYFFIKKGATMWDAVVNLAYKVCDAYPYIRGANCVNFNAPENAVQFSYDERDMLENGFEVTEDRLVSHFHMADIQGEYGQYELTDTDVTDRQIVRHRFFELDRQFLYNPQQALTYRDSYASRGWRRYFCSYSGYRGEDLSDLAVLENSVSGRICRIDIKGSSAGVTTEISVYNDKFYSID